MATYKEIQNYIKEKYDVVIKTCWIAHMKEQCGLPLRKSPNRKDSNKREYPCPDNKREMIIEAFENFNML